MVKGTNSHLQVVLWRQYKTHTHRHTFTHRHICTYTQIPTHIHEHTHLHTHTVGHTHRHTCIHSHTGTHIDTHTLTRAHTHIHTHIQLGVRAHTCVPCLCAHTHRVWKAWGEDEQWELQLCGWWPWQWTLLGGMSESRLSFSANSSTSCSVDSRVFEFLFLPPDRSPGLGESRLGRLPCLYQKLLWNLHAPSPTGTGVFSNPI